MTQSLSILTGCFAGATESIVVTPFELVKIRMQDKNSVFTGPVQVIKETIRKQGVMAMYGGMEATFWRHVMWNGGYFGSIFQIRALLPKSQVSDGHHGALLTLTVLRDGDNHILMKKRTWNPNLTRSCSQSKSGELANNFVSGAIGGAIGTALNTPCKFFLLSLSFPPSPPSITHTPVGLLLGVESRLGLVLRKEE